jgi:hypothetical protein
MTPESEYEIKTIHLSTDNKSSGDLNSPSWIIQSYLDVEAVKVKRFTFPNSIRTIDSRNHHLYLQIGSITAASTKLQLTNGYFNDITMRDLLATTLTGGYNVTLNTTSNRLTVNHTANNFRFISGDNSCNYELGISNQTLNTQQNFNQLDLSGLKNIIVASNISANDVVGSSKKILANIPVNVASKGILQFCDDSSDYIVLNSENINEIGLILYDERMRPLSIDLDWSATINFMTK